MQQSQALTPLQQPLYLDSKNQEYSLTLYVTLLINQRSLVHIVIEMVSGMKLFVGAGHILYLYTDTCTINTETINSPT